jgi:hypothetical protein
MTRGINVFIFLIIKNGEELHQHVWECKALLEDTQEEDDRGMKGLGRLHLIPL